MGYCPRCGEHTPYREADRERTMELLPIRIPVHSHIVPIPPDVPDGATIPYAGCLFSVRRVGEAYELTLLRVGHA